MRILLDNVDINSSSGPNSFGRKLSKSMALKGHVAAANLTPADVQLSFIQTTRRGAPKVALRLDGIYFNTAQNWAEMNRPISRSHLEADLVIYQSEFNKRLTERYFGPAKKSAVIHNGTDVNSIESIQPIQHPMLDRFDQVWCCASSWRPHKRLRDNVEYFLRMRPNNTGLVILGDNPDHVVQHPDVFYTGKQSWETCISVYKRSKKFIHLAFLDHCPNVVVDARAAGCDLVVASSGGTREVAGPEATVIEDLDWDLSPLELYSPPVLDYEKFQKNRLESDIDISAVTDKYIEQLAML